MSKSLISFKFILIGLRRFSKNFKSLKTIIAKKVLIFYMYKVYCKKFVILKYIPMTL